MSLASYEAAISEIFSTFKVAWSAGTSAIVGYVPTVIWQGVNTAVPDASKFFCRVSQQTVTKKQKTLANTSKRFETCGIVIAQIFCPKSDVAAIQKGRKLAKVVVDAFEGKKTTNGIWFLNTRPQELVAENAYERINIISEYEYDEMKGS